MLNHIVASSTWELPQDLLVRQSRKALARKVMEMQEAGLPDGFKVDSLGNVWTSGPAGIWVFSPDGKHLGTLKTPEVPANCNWGDDGKTLYITAVKSVYRIKTAVLGEKPLNQVYQ